MTCSRVSEEVVCLAFDLNTQSLVELHVLNSDPEKSPATHESFEDRTRTAMELSGPCFCQIIDVGEFEGMRYYATAVNDGEFLKDYVARMAPVDVPQALSLVIQLCDAVIEIEQHARLMRGLRLSNLLVCRIDESHIALRMLDLGLARAEGDTPVEQLAEIKMAELSQILFLLLSGTRYVGHQPAQVNSLAGLPANLKVLLRQTLDVGADPVTGGSARPTRLSIFRDELTDSYGAVSQRITRSTAFRPIVAPPRLHPESMLIKQFFGDLDLEQQLGDRYRIIENPDPPLSPYARMAHDLQMDRETIVQFLPASRTLPMQHSQLVIQEMSRIKEDEHPNLIRCRGFWETDRLACIAEEPFNGFGLPLLLAERGGVLMPQEIIILLRQLNCAMDQANSLELTPQALSVYSIEVHFPNESRFRVRELRKRHVDFWPEFVLKLRCHATLESVVSMPPSGRMRAVGDPDPEWLAKMDFIGVAEYLVLGTLPPPSPQQGLGEPEPHHVASMRDFLQNQYVELNQSVDDFQLEGFVDQLEAELTRTQPERSVEVMGTIVDGAIAFSDAAGKKRAIRESGPAAKTGATRAPRPMGGIPAPDPDGEPDSVNPIAEHVRSAAGESDEEPEAMSLGTIDDLDFDIGDSRDKLAQIPGESPDGESDDEDDDAADGKRSKKSGKRKGWFFLK